MSEWVNFGKEGLTARSKWMMGRITSYSLSYLVVGNISFSITTQYSKCDMEIVNPRRRKKQS